MTSTTTGLTPSQRQREAIEAKLGPVLVLAGPGAGKTFCLIERIRYLIEQKNFDPTRICAVTFTNKAAQEIADRLGRTLGERAHEIKGGTLHALCAEILRAHGDTIGVRRGFGIADEDYQKDVLRRLGVFPEKRRGRVLVDFGKHRVGRLTLTADDLDRFNQYRRWLERHNLLDFDELVLKTAELFAAYPEIAAEVAARWDYVLVDEFQDLNPKQYAVVRALTQQHRNVFVVGDDEQSVYSWTGADPEVLRQFANDFEVRDMVVLDENRRNASQIFAAARLLMQRNPQLFDAKVLTARHQSEHPVHALSFEDDHAEARWVLADMLDDKQRHGLDWSDYGVLYRKHEIGDGLEGALLRAGIPCRLASGRALRDNPVVRYLIAALRVMDAPDDPLRQEAFIRGVLPPNQWSWIVSQAEQRKVTPLTLLRRLARSAEVPEEERKKLRRAEAALGNLPGLASRHTTLTGLVEELLSQRVGVYRTVLEDLHEELSDPAADPAVVALAERLAGAQHGRRRVWLPRLGGLELALSGLLLKAGVSSAYLDDGGLPAEGDVVLSKGDGGAQGLALGVFKALQLVRAGALPDAFQSFVAVDIETTDFTAACEIVELGAVRVSNGVIVAEYGQLVKPGVPIAESARRVHGITDEEVREQPTLGEVWSDFRSFCGDDIWVAHNGIGLDFPVLRRLGAELPGGASFVSYDSLPLARSLHSGSRKLGELAYAFGIEVGQAHRARDDARTLALVFLELQKRKLARARKTALAHLLDYLGVALALSDPGELTEEGRTLLRVSRAYALGRYSDCLEHYRLERASPRAFDAPSLEQVIQKLGGRRKLEELRKEKSAAQRYPEAMTRLRRLLDGLPGEALADQLREFLTRVALSRSDTAEQDAELPFRVNLLTLHSTKGLEFSRVYIVGAEDAELPGMRRDGQAVPDAEVHEARRLLYVGMTRARDRLVLTRAERRNELPTGGHQFLTEMKLSPPDARGD